MEKEITQDKLIQDWGDCYVAVLDKKVCKKLNLAPRDFIRVVYREKEATTQ